MDLAHTAQLPDSRSAADLELFLGVVSLDKGDLTSAKATFEHILAKRPDYSPALNLMGRYYELIEDTDNAFSYYHAAVKNRHGSPELLNNLAFRYLDDGNLPVALDYFETSLKESPSFTWAYRGIAYVYDSLGATDKALIALKQGVALSRYDADRENAYEALADYQLSKSNPDQALDSIELALCLNDTSSQAWQIKGRALLAKGKLDRANHAYEEAYHLSYEKGEALRVWAADLADRYYYEQALAKFAAAHTVEPASAKILQDWGHLLIFLGRSNQSTEMFAVACRISLYRNSCLRHWAEALRDRSERHEALERMPLPDQQSKNPNLYVLRGDLEYDLHLYTKGDLDYERAADGSRYPAAVLRNYGSRLLDQGRIHKAVVVLQSAVMADEDNELARIQLATALMHSGDKIGAVSEFNRAVSIAIYPAGVYQAWAAVDETNGQPRLALEHLKQALALDPENWEFRIDRARNLYAIGDNTIGDLELAAAVDSSLTPWNVHKVWGDLLYGKRSFSSAELQYQTALKQAPFVIDAYDGYVRTLKQEGKLAQARQAAKDVIKLNPSSPAAYYIYTSYLISIQQDDEAIKEFDTIASLFPWLGEPLVEKAELLIAAGRFNDAAEAFSLGLQREPDNLSFKLRYATALSASGNFSQSAELYDEIIAAEPGWVDALLGEADVLIQDKRPHEAERVAWKAVSTGVSSSWAYERLGASLVAQRNSSEGFQRYDEAIKQEPTRLDSYFTKAHDSEPPISVDTLNRAVSFGLKSPVLLTFLASEECRPPASNGAVDKALQYFEEAVTTAPSDPGILFDYAICLQRNGYTQQSEEKLGQGVKLDPAYLPFYGSAERAPRDFGSIESAISVLQEFAPADPAIKTDVDARIARLQGMLQSRR